MNAVHSLPKQALATFLAFAVSTLMPVAPSPAQQMPSPPCTECTKLNNTAKLVTQAAIRDLQNVIDRYKAGALRIEDVQASISTSRLYFGYLEENGINAMVDSKLKDPDFRRQVLEFIPTDAEAQSLSQKMTSQSGGSAAVSSTQIKESYSLSYVQRETLLTEVSATGMKEVQSRILLAMEGLKNRVASGRIAGRGNQRHSVVPVSLTISSSPTPPVELCGWLHLAAIIFGTMCFFGCIPCCGAAFMMEIYAWLCDNGLLLI